MEAAPSKVWPRGAGRVRTFPESVNRNMFRRDKLRPAYSACLGMKLPLGREFSADEDRPGGNPVALISYETWQRRFSGEPRVLGARVTLDGKPHVVVGVLPAGFDFFGSVPVYTPLGQYTIFRCAAANSVRGFGR